MNSRDFCFWLQGFFEVGLETTPSNMEFPALTHKQIVVIRNHLSLVFKHEIDPSMGDKKHQDKLDNTHQVTVGGGFAGPMFPTDGIVRC